MELLRVMWIWWWLLTCSSLGWVGGSYWSPQNSGPLHNGEAVFNVITHSDAVRRRKELDFVVTLYLLDTSIFFNQYAIHCKRFPSLAHSWSWALLEKPPIVQLIKNFPAYYGTRRFITVFTRALHWSLSRARSIESIPSHPISLKIHFNIVHSPTSWSS
jgi:hypothetical protein